MRLSHEDVREILRLLDESHYDELYLQTDDFSLTLKRSTEKGVSRPAGRAERKERHTVTRTVERSEASKKGTVKATPETPASAKVVDIYPPLPGTFYRAPQPGAEPFVDVGSAVEENTVVGLIETMKLMNSVMAGCSGEVLEFCTDNGVMVEAGDVLLRVHVNE